MEFNATFLASMISFILFVLVMNGIFYNPIRKIILERKSYIDGQINDANCTNNKAEGILQEKDEKIKSAQIDARDLISKGVESAKVSNQEAIASKQTEANNEIENRKNTLLEEKNSVKSELKSNVSDLAKIISGKIFGDDLANIEDNSDLVSEVIDNV